MAGIKGNRRTIYTKMILKESLIKLLQNNEIHKITVTDICKEADINRGTFYSYYNDPFHLFQCIEDELFDKILELLNQCSEQENKVTVLTKIFELAKENRDFCKILLCNLGDSRILNKIITIANQDDLIKMNSNFNNTTKAYFNYLTRFAISGSVGVLQAWVENDFKESPEEVATIVDNITKKIFTP